MDEEKLLAQLNATSLDSEDYEPARSDDDAQTAEVTSDNDDSTLLTGRDPLPPRMHAGSSQPSAASASGYHRTGPKGVMADYKHHQRVERERLQEKERLRQESVWKPSSRPPLHQLDGDADVEDDELFEDAEEQEAIRRYRDKRIQQLSTRLSTSRKTFGSLIDIAQDQYVSEIDDELQSVPILIHLYEPLIPECRTLNDSLSELARRYIHAKFLRIRAREAQFNVSADLLPALLVYRGGLLIGNWMQATVEVETAADVDRGMFSTRILEDFLIAERMLDVPDRDAASVGSEQSGDDD